MTWIVLTPVSWRKPLFLEMIYFGSIWARGIIQCERFWEVPCLLVVGLAVLGAEFLGCMLDSTRSTTYRLSPVVLVGSLCC